MAGPEKAMKTKMITWWSMNKTVSYSKVIMNTK